MLFSQALLTLLVYDVLSTFCRFETIYSMVKGWTVASASPGRTNDTIDRVCRAVNLACIWYPKQSLCLQRSFLTTYLLRKSGIAACMVLGAQKLPFKAHAWVEVDGQAINERSNVQAAYTVWDRC
jgi:prolyl oligopeptidase